MSRSSLRTITDISIDGQALDAATQRQTLRFKVNCDSLSWVRIKYYDNTNGDSFTRYYPKGGVMIAKHNGEWFSGWFGYDPETQTSPFTLNHDYTAVPTIFQNYPDSVNPDNTGPGKYDVLLGSGRVQADSLVSNEVYIDKDIQSIQSPVYFEDETTHQERLVGGCMLQIDGVQRLITAYDPSTGKATLASAIPATVGKLYYLVSNYLECDPFYFYIRSDPEVTITPSFDDEKGIAVSGVYSQAEEVAMQSYQFSCAGELGNKSFTYTFEDKFPLPYTLAEELHSVDVSCDVFTQENHYLRETETLAAPSTLDTATMTLTLTESTALRYVRAVISSAPSDATVFLWRLENDRAALVRVITGTTGTDITVYDRTAEYGKSYTYKAIVSKTVNAATTIYAASAEITPTSRVTKLSLLTDSGESYHRKKYTVGSSQTFDIGGEQKSINQAIGAEIYETEAGQPSAVYTERNYESGTLTVYADKLGSIAAPISSGLDNINTLRNFIASKQPFLMLDNAGNARIIALTSANREFDRVSQMTRLTFGWTEICKTENAIIG